MISKCLLETNGYRISFEFTYLETKKYMDMIVEFIIDPSLGGFLVRSIPTCIDLIDLQRLLQYFEHHIESLRQNLNTESYTFVPTELGFQVQALSGDQLSENDLEFTIRFMVNVGRYKKEGTSVYVGGESVVNLKNIKDFTKACRKVLI